MPELPEVQTVVDSIATKLAGQRITHVDLRRQDIVTPIEIDFSDLLMGQKIDRIWRRAKRIMFELDNANRFYIHLGMSGQLKLASSEKPVIKHTHLIVTFKSQQLHFRDPRRFGGIFWLGKNHQDDPRLGPEPLEMSASDLAKRLAKTRRPIKVALMDQSLVAGLGNIYADEALFDAKINPRRPASTLSAIESRRLTQSIKTILQQAILHRGSTLRDYVDGRGRRGKYQNQHQVYQRTGKACLTCKGNIEKITLGGRSTHFCPACQKSSRRSAH